MKLVAIDFETANVSRSSACSLGIAVQNADGSITNEEYYIKPVPCEFRQLNTSIHGISAEDVQNAPTFTELLPSILPQLTNALVLTHNANFDMDVFVHSLSLDQAPPFELEYLCTEQLSEKVLPDLKDADGKNNHRLDFLAKLFEIPLIHHTAASDAQASLEIFIKLMELQNAKTPEELLQQFNMSLGHLTNDGKACRQQKFSIEKSYFGAADTAVIKKLYQKARKISPEVKEANIFSGQKVNWQKIRDIRKGYPLPHFVGKSFVATGEFNSEEKQKILEYIRLFGGRPISVVSAKTDYLIVGDIPVKKLKGRKSAKLQKAEALQNSGSKIQILSEFAFWQLIDADRDTLDELIAQGMQELSAPKQTAAKKDIIDLLPVATNYINQLGLDFGENSTGLSITPLKSGGVSISFFGLSIGQFTMRGRKPNKQIVFSTPQKMIDYINLPELPQHEVANDVDAKNSFPITEDLTALLRAIYKYALETPGADIFGCCHRYMECSAARRCLHPNINIARNCQYRRSLMAGKIFYGANKNV